MSYRIHVDGVEEQQRRLERMGRTRIPDELVEGMVDVVKTLKGELQTEIDETFLGEGNLRKRVTARRVIRRRRGEIEGRVGFSKKGFYWRFLEHGTVTGVPAFRYALSVQQDNAETVQTILLAALERATS